MENKKTLEFLVGISASGKSTYAKQKVTGSNNWMIVNRDSIRKSLFGYTDADLSSHYTSKMLGRREKIVSYNSHDIIGCAVNNQQNVIIDNTNLSWKYIKDYLVNWGDDFNVKFTIFPLDEKLSIQRDQQREAMVGKEVIAKQVQQYNSLMNNPDFKKLIE